jgi:hypothetical protein
MSLLSLPIVLGIQQKPTWHRCLYRHRCMEIFSAIPWIWLSFEFLLGRGVEVVTWAAPVSCGKLCSPQDPVVLCLYPMSSAASSSSDSMLGLKQRQQQWWHDMTVVSFLCLCLFFYYHLRLVILFLCLLPCPRCPSLGNMKTVCCLSNFVV